MLVVPAFFALLYAYVYASFVNELTTAQQMECVSAIVLHRQRCACCAKNVLEVWMMPEDWPTPPRRGCFGTLPFAHGHTASYLMGALSTAF